MLVVHVISNLDTGGAETSLFQLVKNNIEDRQIVVSMQDRGVFGDQFEALGVEVVSLGMKPGRLSFFGLKKLFKLIRKQQPTIIQTWMYHADLIGGLVARLALNNRVCWGIHHANLDRSANPSTLLIVVKLCAFVSWFVPRKIISCSERSRQVHSAARYRNSKITVVPNGYDLNKFVFSQRDRDEFRSSLNVTNDCLLGMVGRWHPQKDHQNLIDALVIYNQQAIQPVRCVLVGKGMDEENVELIHALDSAGVRKYFVLFGETPNVSGVMSGIDLHILCSRGEAFPNVVAEAMACQTPCVVTDVGDAGLIVGDTGWVVPAESAEALAAGISSSVEATKEKKSWQQRRISCRARIVDEYEIGHIVNRYRAVWQQIADLK